MRSAAGGRVCAPRLFLAGLVVGAACAASVGCSSSPSAPSAPTLEVFPPMTGQWLGAILISFPHPFSGEPASVACNFDWSITQQAAGRFSGQYRSSPGQGSFFPLEYCSRTGSISGVATRRGDVTEVRFDPAPGASDECVALSQAALQGPLGGDYLTANGNDRVRCQYGDGPITTPRVLHVDMNKLR